MGDLKDLKKAAEIAMKNAYAPYSQVHVGVALRTASGAIFSGCNVENASSAGVCAEQSAVSAAVTQGEQKISEVFIMSDQAHPLPPCGRCRQTLWEFGTPQVPVTWQNQRGESQTATLGELLPYAFGQEHLTKL